MIGIDDAKSISLSVGGKRVDVCYYEAGSAERGSVIFVQTGGAGTTAYMCWHMNIEAFADAGFRVYAPDAPGFGKSKLASADTGSVDGEGFLLAFMDAVGVSQAHLVGNSMGAMTAARFAASNPGRVRSVTLSGGEPRLDTDETKAIAPTLGATPRMNFVREMLSKPQLAADDMRRATADFFYDRDHPAVEGAARLRLDAGEDNLVVGTDYGHQDQSSEIEAMRNMRDKGDVDPAVIDKIMGENAVTLYGLQDAVAAL